MKNVVDRISKTILIIDDDESNVSFLNNILKEKYSIKSTYNGNNALNILDKFEIDLVLLDIEMPLINGFEVAKKIKSQIEYKDIPIIFITANRNDEETLVKGFESGAKDFITKPFNPKELEVRIKTHITSYEQKKIIQEDIKKIELRDKIISDYLIFSETDLNGVITNVSQAFCELSEYSADELIGNTHKIVRHPDTSNTLFKELWETITAQKTWTGEIKNRTKSGHYYWVLANISPNYDEKGNHIGYISIRQEITAKKDHELQQEIQFKEAKMNALNELISNISHHWRQPLSVISTTASGLKIEYEYDMFDKDNYLNSLDAIVSSTQSLSETINEFSQYINLDENLDDYILEEQLKLAIDLIRPILSSHGINIIENIDYNNKTTIKLSKSLFIQSIVNIFNNSIDAILLKNNQEKYINVSLNIVNNFVELNIKDNGGGISKENIASIFEPYFTTKHKSKGKGLSLYMTHRTICETLNGTINAENTDNGVLISIKLPLN